MPDQSEQSLGINAWLEEELQQQFRHDPQAVDESWRPLLKSNGPGRTGNGNGAISPATANPAVEPGPSSVRPGNGQPAIPVAANEEAVTLTGIAGKIAENMNASLAVPTATSQRVVAVKALEENRALLNQHRAARGQSKISFTHLVGYALLRALDKQPGINHAYTELNGKPTRIVRAQVNFGLAVDVAGKDGSRSLLVPNIKDAGKLPFAGFLKAFDDVVARARTNKLGLPDFQGTSISLTNPGTVGTYGSVPRLVPGQGAIIATGAMDFPAEYAGVAPDVKAMLGLSKVMMVTCTYDHRVIQGAESGAFLGVVQALLQGEDNFYGAIFTELGVPFQPVMLQAERRAALPALDPAQQVTKALAVSRLVQAYRELGHRMAALDPLGSPIAPVTELEPGTHGLSVWDLDREFPGQDVMVADKKGRPKASATLREILDTLRQAYCGALTAEYMHIPDAPERAWWRERMEDPRHREPLDSATRLRVLERITQAEEFEHFLDKRFIGQKRFSAEGGETTLAMLEELLLRAAGHGVHEVVIGMAHRGRLNVLCNVVGKPLSRVFREFEGVGLEELAGAGDVKYHLGYSNVRALPGGREIGVTLAFNPSHLEAVNPVVEGLVRPRQERLGDAERKRVMPVLLHGDAAFTGQGVVMETLNFSRLPGYTTGGTVHLVVNNQIGFTTPESQARSGTYCTDIAKMIDAPVLHVNGDDPEAAVRAITLAYDYRQQFHRDVVIDLVCYRRLGHNEGDDPGVTQPLMYREIERHASTAKLYAARLVGDKLLSAADVEALRKKLFDGFAAAHDEAKQRTAESQPTGATDLAVTPVDAAAGGPHPTAVQRGALERVVDGLTRFPETFQLQAKLKKFIDKRLEVGRNNGPIDWAFGEALAFGTLVLEGTPVRLSGQDSVRGTFTQRHLGYADAETGLMHLPIQHLAPGQARCEVLNSPLSEFGVMGFEYGYSVADPQTLVLWEGQFGDFVNGAQIILDQFLAAGESKWGQPCGLVLLLPHGFEGQGPEHSSARIERFLQLCAEDNLQVCNCTTPAQYFHLLRRQMYGQGGKPIRKPLVIPTPKSLLRHARAVSPLDEFAAGTFRPVLADTMVESSGVTRVVMCSGKVYYDLLEARERQQANHVALVRLEQLYPFPQQELRDALARYPAATQLLWAQEEPRNMGAWVYLGEHFAALLEGQRTVRHVGRPEAASPAVGSPKRHLAEQAELLEAAFAAEPVTPVAKKGRGRKRVG